MAFVDLSGETYIRYTPLACFYLQAAVAADAGLAVQVETRVHEFTQGHTTAEMIREVVAWEPDVIAMSCQGWNFRQLAATFAPIKQFVPGARLVLGGNHVTHRAERLLPAYPEVDVLVNGEGEFTIVEYLRALLDGGDLRAIAGLSYRGADGIVTTAERPRTRQMGEIPSPYALAGVDYTRYDVALLETNRGCPYACAFCYWGGRIGQKIARGELERVQAEIEVIGKAKIQTIFLCDANFGILAQDVEVARMIVASYQRYGAPSEFNVNWAKNHSSRVGEIVGILRAGGVRTTINIPLQTLSSKALQISGRSEIGRRAIVELAMGLVRDGTELFCELIFGMPGESLADFRRNYDELYLQFPILRIHPLWLLPNTEYQNRRAELGIRTHSPDPFSDYEAVLAHRDMPIADTMDGLALLLAHSILSLLGPARDVLRLLARHDARSVAAMLCALEPFLARREDPLATGLAELFSRIRRACYFERSLRDRKRELLYRSRADTYALMSDFLESQGVPEAIRGATRDLLRYDCLLLPRSEIAGEGQVSEQHAFDLDPVELAHRLAAGDEDWREVIAHPRPTILVITHRAGLAKLSGRNCDLTGSWNGRVTSRQELAERGAGGFAQEGLR